jgi:hypothetical protein
MGFSSPKQWNRRCEVEPPPEIALTQETPAGTLRRSAPITLIERNKQAAADRPTPNFLLPFP